MKTVFSFACLMSLMILSSACGRHPPERETAHVVSDDTAEASAHRKFSGPVVSFMLSGDSELNFTGYKVGGSQHGSFLFFDGTLTAQGVDPESLKIEVFIPLESLMTDDPGLAPVLLGPNFFNADKHPEGHFASRHVKKTDGGFTVVGDLTLNGVTKTLSFPAKIEMNDDEIRINAAFQVNRQWWGLTWKGVGEYVMRDRVDLEINARAERSDED